MQRGMNIVMTNSRILIDGNEAGDSDPRSLFEASGSAMMIVEENGTISMVNEEFERLFGYPRESVENRKSWTEFLMEKGGASQGESLFFDRRMSEKTVCTNVKAIPGTQKWLVSITDLTDQKEADGEIRRLTLELTRANADLLRELKERREIERELMHKAHHDSLTGLPNRDLFLDRLKQAFAFAERHNSMFALMLIDLDNFKCINDTAGHLAGDILLKDVAKRLRGCMRQYDTVARFGGDEFIVIVNDMKSMEDVVRFAEKVRALFRQPFEVNGEPMEVTVSMGIAVYPFHGADTEALLKKADISMYQAKRDGKNALRFFSYTIC